jgi:hypothetical protein
MAVATELLGLVGLVGQFGSLLCHLASSEETGNAAGSSHYPAR